MPRVTMLTRMRVELQRNRLRRSGKKMRSPSTKFRKNRVAVSQTRCTKMKAAILTSTQAKIVQTKTYKGQPQLSQESTRPTNQLSWTLSNKKPRRPSRLCSATWTSRQRCKGRRLLVREPVLAITVTTTTITMCSSRSTLIRQSSQPQVQSLTSRPTCRRSCRRVLPQIRLRRWLGRLLSSPTRPATSLHL